MELVDRRNGRFVWLQGSPGTGKTAISKSTAHSLAQDKRLAASFFWDKTGSRAGADSIDLFPTTLASQLATFSRDYEMLLVNRLLDRSFRNVLRRPLKERLESLVLEPLSSISKVFPSEGNYPVVVLDGLDECGGRDALAKLMELVLLFNRFPPNFMILVSARPELEIRTVLGPSQGVPGLYTDKISKKDTNHTIRVMVERGLAEIPQLHSTWMPSEDDLCAFARTCHQLPVLAEIRVRQVRILASSGYTFQRAFHIVKDDAATSRDLNDDYLHILRRAYRYGNVVYFALFSGQTAGSPMGNTEHAVSPYIHRTYRDVVGAVLALRIAPSVQVVSRILAISEGDIRAVLDPIGSIVNTPTSSDKPVHFYHATAKEFLIGPPYGDKDDRVFFFDTKGAVLALPLLKILNHKDNLKRNVHMAHTADPVPLGAGKHLELRHLPQHMAYAADWWSTHFDLSLVSEELWKELRLFLTTNLLFWMELQMDHESALRLVLEQKEVSSTPSFNETIPLVIQHVALRGSEC